MKIKDKFFKRLLLPLILFKQISFFSNVAASENTLICRVRLTNEEDPFRKAIPSVFCPIVNFKFQNVRANDSILTQAISLEQAVNGKTVKRIAKGMITTPIVSFLIFALLLSLGEKTKAFVTKSFLGAIFGSMFLVGIFSIPIGLILLLRLSVNRSRVLINLTEDAFGLGTNTEIIIKIQNQKEAKSIDVLMDYLHNTVFKSTQSKPSPIRNFCWKFENAELLCPEKNPQRSSLIIERADIF